MYKVSVTVTQYDPNGKPMSENPANWYFEDVHVANMANLSICEAMLNLAKQWAADKADRFPHGGKPG